MRTSDSLDKIAEALALAQGTIKTAPKDSANPFFKGSFYADLSSLWDACREPLFKNDLAVIQAPSFQDGRTVLTTRILHKSGQWIECDLSMKPTQDTPQAIGSAITYMRRYALGAFLGIVASEDDDGNAASTPTAPVKSATVQKSVKTSETPAAPVAIIFDKNNAAHKKKLEGIMTEQGVDLTEMDYILDMLHGKDANKSLKPLLEECKRRARGV